MIIEQIRSKLNNRVIAIKEITTGIIKLVNGRYTIEMAIKDIAREISAIELTTTL